jgi:hypothetical protein
MVDHISHGREAVYAAQFAVDTFAAEPVAHRGSTAWNWILIAISSSAIPASVCALCMSTRAVAERSSTTSFGSVDSARIRVRILCANTQGEYRNEQPKHSCPRLSRRCKKRRVFRKRRAALLLHLVVCIWHEQHKFGPVFAALVPVSPSSGSCP